MATPGMDLGQGISEDPQAPPQQQQPQMDHKSAVGHIFHGVYSALGGGRPVLTGHADEQGVPETRPGQPGDWARGIIAGALTGLAAGAAAPPGSPASGLGIGAVAAQGQANQQNNQLRQQAQQEFQNKEEAQQRNQQQLLNQAQIAHLNQITAASAWDQKVKGIELTAQQVKNYDEQQALIASNPANKDLGTYATFDDFLKALPNNPDLAALQAQGKIRATVGPDGVHIAQIDPAWADQKNDKPVTLNIPSGVDKAGNPIYKAQTIPVGAMSNGQILTAQQALSSKELEMGEKRFAQEQETNRTRITQAGENYRQNRQMSAQSASSVEALPPALQSAVRGLANYEVDPSSFPSRTMKNSGQLDRATAIGLAKQLNPNFDEKQYKVASGVRRDFTSGKSAQNIRSLNTAIGHLDQLSSASTALNNGDTQILNRLANTYGVQVGKSPVVTFNAVKNAVTAEVAAVYKGTGATDQEINAIKTTFDSSQSPQQLDAAVKTTMRLFQSRLHALDAQYKLGLGAPADFQILNNESQGILQRHGFQPSQDQGQPQATHIYDPSTNTIKPIAAGPR